MGRPAFDMDDDLILARCRIAHEAGVAMRIKGIAVIHMKQTLVEVLRAMHTALLRYREDHLQRTMRQLTLLDLTQSFEDCRHTGLVIATENRRTIRMDEAVLDDRMDTCTGLDAVHMCRQHDCRRPRHCPREIRHEVAGIATELRTSAILMHLSSERLQTARQYICYLALIMRRAAHRYERTEIIEQSLFIDLAIHHDS